MTLAPGRAVRRPVDQPGQDTARATARGLGEGFLTAGVLVLLFVVWQLWWTDVSAGRAQRATTHQLQQQWQRGGSTTAAPPRAGHSGAPAGTADVLPAVGQPFALLRVPRFGAGYVRPVLQGTSLPVLEDGVGHYLHSAGPGDLGNFALAGHRVTYAKPFNEIATLRAGDAVVVETRDDYYVYRVVRHLVVAPDRVDVVAAVPERPGAAPTRRLLTLTACHPEFSARERYVVIAELQRTVAKPGASLPTVLAAAG